MLITCQAGCQFNRRIHYLHSYPQWKHHFPFSRGGWLRTQDSWSELCSLHYLPLCSCVMKIMIAAFNHLSSPLTVHWTWDNSDLPAPEFPDLLQGLLYGTCLIDHYYIHELKSPITSSCLTLLGLRVAFHPIHADHFARQWGRTPSSLFLPRTFIPHSAVSP